MEKINKGIISKAFKGINVCLDCTTFKEVEKRLQNVCGCNHKLLVYASDYDRCVISFDNVKFHVSFNWNVREWNVKQF